MDLNKIEKSGPFSTARRELGVKSTGRYYGLQMSPVIPAGLQDTQSRLSEHNSKSPPAFAAEIIIVLS
jgi:hypothetical protein